MRFAFDDSDNCGAIGFGGVIAPAGLYDSGANHVGVRPPDETPGEVRMKAKVTEVGGLITKEMLEGIQAEEVEIRKEISILLGLPITRLHEVG